MIRIVSHLSENLRAVETEETALVASYRERVARQMATEALPAGLQDIPGVRGMAKGKLSRPVAKRPVNTGAPLSDWVAASHR